MKEFHPNELGRYVYHVSHRDSLGEISSNGIVPQGNVSISGHAVSGRRVYVSRSKSYVEQYAQSIGEDAVFFVIETNKLPKQMVFYRDEEDEWSSESEVPELLFTTTTIPPTLFVAYDAEFQPINESITSHITIGGLRSLIVKEFFR